jgi:predicted ATPase
VLLIVTFRPEFNAPWAGRSHVTSLALNRLGEREATAIIARIVGNKDLPADVTAEIVERTDGIPLFVEEMTKAVLEAESEGDGREIAATMPSSVLAVPASLHASLMARLDRLGPAKEIAQIGAAIGREFSHALLAAVARKPQVELQSAFDRLITAGLLFRQGVPPQAAYLFKHALVQDAAYGTLLREVRRALHARIAETLESQFADIAENQPEILARHCTEAGLIEKAAGFWGKAGQRSLARSALIEAVEQLTRAVAQIATLPTTPALRREEIEVQVALITALRMSKGHAAPEPKAAAERARLLIETAVAVGEPPDDPLLLFSVLFGFFVECTTAFNADASRETASQVLELAKKQSASFPLVIGHGFWGSSLLLRGELTEGRKHLDQSLAFYEPIKHRPLATRFGEDQKVAHLCWRSIALWALGFPKQGIADADNAIKEAEEIGHAGTSLFALNFTSLAHIECGNYALIKAQSAKAMALADEKKASFWRAYGALNHGFILALTGEAYDAVHIISSGIAAWQSTGATMFLPTWLTRLAAGYAALSELNDAWRSIGEAKRIVETSGERWFEAEVYRVAGELALLSSECDIAKPETYFECALAVARQQQAKSWELRAAMSLARLWRDQGKVSEARELLAPVYGWFTEGFDTRDLKEAKALLEELA